MTTKQKTAAERLSTFMKRRGWSQERLAGEIGCHQTSISSLLRGAVPNVILAVQIAKLTRIPVTAWGAGKEDWKGKA